MASLFGAFERQGAPVAQDALEAMAAPLRRRCPDGIATRLWEQVGFGHGALFSTPEARSEALPLTHRESGCHVTADLRLDNRGALIDALGLGPAAQAMGDAELLLHGYLKWGTDLPRHLLGDFAFAIWDPRSRALFCARDPIGMKPFAFCRTDARFVFASLPQAVACHPAIAARLSKARIVDLFLNPYVATIAFDQKCTFWSDIERLPPATALLVETHKSRSWTYWTLKPDPLGARATDADYEAAYRHHLRQAVDCRLRSSGPAASMLSGGMDSSSVVAMAADLARQGRVPRLITVSAVSDAPDCPETRMIRQTQRLDGIDPRDVPLWDHIADPRQLLADLQAQTDPFDWGFSMHRLIYRAARDAGAKVVLDGVMGDALMRTENAIPRMIRRGRLLSAWRAHCDIERIFGREDSSAQRQFYLSLRRALAPRWAKRRAFEASRPKAIDGLLKRSHLSTRLQDRLGARDRLEAYFRENYQAGFLSDADELASVVTHPIQAASRETYDRLAGEFGLEARDPFGDTRLIAFCAALPDGQKLRNGWIKSLSRRAMRGFLPDPVRHHNSYYGLGGTLHAPLQRALTAQEDERSFTDQLGETALNAPIPLEVDLIRRAFYLWCRNNAISTEYLNPGRPQSAVGGLMS